MTKRLILIRHAKSSWADPDADDHDRVLNKRGVQSAKAIGTWMAEHYFVPDVILCSDAMRTRQTAEQIMPAVPPKLESLLYHAAPDTILDLIRRQAADVVAVIGHNPGIGMMANAMVGAAPMHHRFSDYPTCATTVIDFQIDHWPELMPQTGVCQAFTVPRDLIGTTGHDID